MLNSSEALQIPPAVRRLLRSRFLSEPRELSGRLLTSIERIVEEFAGPSPSDIVAEWYRSATPADYGSHRAAVAYLGAYGARSILKIQESVIGALFLRGRVMRETCLVDYGCGPFIGLLAVADVWTSLSEGIGEALSLVYRPVDRCSSMIEMGAAAYRLLQPDPRVSIVVEQVADGNRMKSDWLLISNVLNEGEGIDDPSRTFAAIAKQVAPREVALVIEPATEFPCRALCTLGDFVPGFSHAGPCPSTDSRCNEWSFREFKKRTYAVETLCLGDYTPAARVCKFGLAIFTPDTSQRPLDARENVVVGKRRVDGSAAVCRNGERRLLALEETAKPWDIVDDSGKLVRRWP